MKYTSTYHVVPTNVYKHDPFTADGNVGCMNFYSTAKKCPHGRCTVHRMDVVDRNTFLLLIEHDHGDAS